MRGIFHIGFLLLLSGSGLAQQQGTSSQLAFGEIRQALVIGNSKHPLVPLPNPVNDARAMRKALADLGFEVTLLTDANEVEMEEQITAFIDGIKKDSVVIVFFAGHGVEYQGHNYLIPIDLFARRAAEVKAHGIDVSTVLEELEQSPARIRLVILDACRDNPYPYETGRTFTRGLAPQTQVRGSYVAFSTAPGSVARDGTPEEQQSRTSLPADSVPSGQLQVGGGNSVFTGALVRELANKQPGSTLDDVFTRVRVQVAKLTNDEQTPFSNSGLKGTWYPFGHATLPDPNEYEIKPSMDAVESAARLIASGKNAEALRALDAAIRLDWKNSLAYIYRGLLRGMDGKQGDDLTDFSEAIRVDPSNYRAYLNRGLALKGAGKCLDAIASFDQAAEKAPEKAEIYRYRAACQAEIGAYDKAEEDLQKSAALEGGWR